MAAIAGWVNSSLRVPDQRGRVEAFVGKNAVDQQSGPRAGLPIHEAQALAREIAKGMYAGGVAVRQHEPLLAIDEADQAVAARSEQPPKRREHLRAGGRQRQVKAGDLGTPRGELLQRGQTAHEGQFELEARRARALRHAAWRAQCHDLRRCATVAGAARDRRVTGGPRSTPGPGKTSRKRFSAERCAATSRSPAGASRAPRPRSSATSGAPSLR